MNKKVSIKNIVVGTLIILSLASLIFIDYKKVEIDLKRLYNALTLVRNESMLKNKIRIVKFIGKGFEVIDYYDKSILGSLEIPTLSDVQYDTTLGDNMIVFDSGTTSAFNKRIHGGEIILKSILGFTKHLHINCAGYIREGRYPEEIE